MASEYDVLLDEPVAAQAKSGPSEYDALLQEPAAAAPEKAQPWYYPAATVQAIKNIGQGFQRSAQDVANAPTLPEKILRTVGGAAGNLFNIPMQAGNAFLSSIPGVNQLSDQAIGGMFSRVPVPGTQGTVGDVAQGAQYEAQQHPRAMANLGAAANIAGVLPVGKMVSGAADALKGMGEVAKVENLAKVPVTPAGNMTALEVRKAAEVTNAAPKANILSTLNPKERNILAEPLSQHDTPFTHYAVTAKKAMNDAREPSPMDVAGSKAKEAFDQLMDQKSAIGKEKGDLINAADNHAIENGKFVNGSGLADDWNNLLAERGGIKITDEGKVAPVAGRLNRINDEMPMVGKINDIMKQIPDEATPLQLDDAKAAIRNVVDNYKASQTTPINTITEGIGKTMRGKIDDRLSSWAEENGFGKLNDLNKQYADLSDVTGQLNRRLGEVTDPTTGQTRMGASLMKSAVMSNSDRGSKALFDRVKAYTGKDLVKEALYAKIAMDAVGDARATDLLHSMAETKDFVKGIAEHPTIMGAVAKIGEAGLNAVRGDRLTQMINYYNKVQGGKTPTPFLKNRAGAIGGTDITPVQQAPGSARQQIIDETLPDNANARNAAQAGYQRAQDAYARAQALLKNRAGSIGGMTPLNDVEGNQIAQNLGVKYNGIQQGFGRAPGGYIFTNTEPGKESTFLARNAEEAGLGLQKTRKLFNGRAGSGVLPMLGLTAGISGAAGAAGLALERRKNKKSVGNMKAKEK
jgi:hypothetical protein